MTIDICAAAVKRQDYGRYVTTLFAPRYLRKYLWVLYALNCELIHIRQVVAKEKMMGLIRLQWWRDSIAAIYSGHSVNHHVLQALSEVLHDKSVWQLQDFDALVTAYEEDFRHDNDDITRSVEQNKIVLKMATRLFNRDTDPQIVDIIAEHYTYAKTLLQNRFTVTDKEIFITASLRELDAIPRKKIRGRAPLLLIDIARYDYMSVRDKKHTSPEIYRSLMAFYLWRRNLFFNIGSV